MQSWSAMVACRITMAGPCRPSSQLDAYRTTRTHTFLAAWSSTFHGASVAKLDRLSDAERDTALQATRWPGSVRPQGFQSGDPCGLPLTRTSRASKARPVSATSCKCFARGFGGFGPVRSARIRCPQTFRSAALLSPAAGSICAEGRKGGLFCTSGLRGSTKSDQTSDLQNNSN